MSDYSIYYTIEGMHKGCFAVNSLLLSTLECFYSKSGCFSTLLNSIKAEFSVNAPYPTSFHYQPLVYDSLTSRFPPNASISFVFKQMMVEKWKSLTSYRNYYEACAPSYCIYTVNARANTRIDVLITLISLIGGVTTILRFVVPRLVVIISYILKFILRRLFGSRKHEQQPQQDGNR